MPKIGHIVLAKEAMRNKKSDETILVNPFSVLTPKSFPFKPKFTVSIGVFNLSPGTTYNFAYFFYTPHGDKITGKIFDIQANPDVKSKFGVDFTLNININDIEFKEAGIYHFRFQIVNLHEEKSTFFYIKQKDDESDTGDTNE